MGPRSIREYEFDGFRVEVASRRLRKADSTPVELSARGFDVLLYLLQHPGEDVSKEHLLHAAWPNLVVEENNLNQAITALRRALGDRRDEPRYIMTVAGRGYRFVASVTVHEAVDEPASAPKMKLLLIVGALVAFGVAAIVMTRTSGETAGGEITSVAVLPFRAIVAEQSNPPLQLGMADALIAQLSELPDIAVSPLSSVAKHTRADEDPIEIGRTLGVSAVLEGTLQKEGDRLRVTSRLLRVSDGHTLWSGRFDEKVTGIFQVQDSIAGLVMLTLAEQLGKPPPKHLAKRSTLNPEAYQLYASGIYNWLRRDIDATDAAVADFKAAIREDPDYAMAWASLAGVLCAQSAFGIKPAVAVLPEAKLAAQHALDLDSELAEAHATMGHVLVQLEHRYVEGERYYQRARELNPSLGFARLWSSINFLNLGRPEDALAQARRAQELEPGNLAFSANVGRVLYYSHQYEAAIAHLDRLLTLMPTFADARSLSGRALLHQGKTEAALTQFAAQNRTSPGSFGDMGRAYAMAGRPTEAHAEIDKLRAKASAGFGMSYDIAGIHALLGEFGPACDSLNRALDDHSQLVGTLRLDPDFDGMREQPCVADVIRKLDAT